MLWILYNIFLLTGNSFVYIKLKKYTLKIIFYMLIVFGSLCNRKLHIFKVFCTFNKVLFV